VLVQFLLLQELDTHGKLITEVDISADALVFNPNVISVGNQTLFPYLNYKTKPCVTLFFFYPFPFLSRIQNNSVSFSTTVLGNTSINVSFLLALEAQILAAGNITFGIAKDTTKWSLDYQNWPFQNINNTLRLVLRFIILLHDLKYLSTKLFYSSKV
jgi:hypothetical protein